MKYTYIIDYRWMSSRREDQEAVYDLVGNRSAQGWRLHSVVPSAGGYIAFIWEREGNAGVKISLDEEF